MNSDIKALRQQSGISQLRLSQALGGKLSRYEMSLAENGLRKLTEEQAEAVYAAIRKLKGQEYQALSKKLERGSSAKTWNASELDSANREKGGSHGSDRCTDNFKAK